MTLSTRIKDLPNRERPRERLGELGPDALSDAELIAILLCTGLQGKPLLNPSPDFPLVFVLMRKDRPRHGMRRRPAEPLRAERV